MMPTLIKVRVPIGGLGKISVEFTRGFKKLAPERKLSILRQLALTVRAEDDRAKAENLNLIKAEDARNAEAIQLRTAS